MKRAQFAVIVAMSGCLFACKSADKKTTETPKALQYNVIRTGSGDPVQAGNYLKMQVRQMYNDSLLHDTRDAAPKISAYDTAAMTPESFKIFAGVREGDSLTFSMPIDSAYGENRPSFAKSGGFLNTTVKILHIYRSKAEVTAETGETAY